MKIHTPEWIICALLATSITLFHAVAVEQIDMIAGFCVGVIAGILLKL